MRSSSEITPLSYVAALAPYQAGAARRKDGGVVRFTLSSNESLFGASPQAIAAAQAWLNKGLVNRYPDTRATQLRLALAAKHDLDPEMIVCGNGSDELIALLVQAYCGVGDEVVMSHYGFIYYRVAAHSVGARVIDVPEDDDFRLTPEAVLAACSSRTKVVFLANPNNPTGFIWQQGALESLRESLPRHILLVIDAAYAEYVTQAGYQDGRGLVGSGGCVMLRTFSKIYGLSGLRVGWGYMPKAVADVLLRLRAPFSVNMAGQVAATAALADDAFYRQVAQATCARRQELLQALAGVNHLRAYASGGNFVLVRFRDAPAAVSTYTDLCQQGIIVRRLDDYGLPSCLRITVGTQAAIDAVLQVLAV